MRALLKAPNDKPWLDEFMVEMLGRTARNTRIKVQGLNRGAPTFAADKYRLFDANDRNRRISEAEFAALPWAGAGKDPAITEPADLYASLEQTP